MKHLEFIDAQEMAKEYPDTFEAPTKEDLDKVKIQDEVKVCANGAERFWVTVTDIKEDVIKGKVDNDLISTNIHGLRLHDTIVFEKRHIYSTYE